MSSIFSRCHRCHRKENTHRTYGTPGSWIPDDKAPWSTGSKDLEKSINIIFYQWWNMSIKAWIIDFHLERHDGGHLIDIRLDPVTMTRRQIPVILHMSELVRSVAVRCNRLECVVFWDCYDVCRFHVRLSLWHYIWHLHTQIWAYSLVPQWH